MRRVLRGETRRVGGRGETAAKLRTKILDFKRLDSRLEHNLNVKGWIGHFLDILRQHHLGREIGRRTPLPVAACLAFKYTYTITITLHIYIHMHVNIAVTITLFIAIYTYN